jgi:hypothetical protein
VQALKHEYDIVSTDAGTQIDASHEHSRNAELTSFEILEGDSNVTFQRYRQPLKQLPAIVSTDEGMQIS